MCSVAIISRAGLFPNGNILTIFWKWLKFIMLYMLYITFVLESYFVSYFCCSLSLLSVVWILYSNYSMESRWLMKEDITRYSTINQCPQQAWHEKYLEVSVSQIQYRWIGRKLSYLNTLRPKQNDRHFPDDTFKMHFHDWKYLNFDYYFTEVCSWGPN